PRGPPPRRIQQPRRTRTSFGRGDALSSGARHHRSSETTPNPPEAESAQDNRGTEEDRLLGPLECPVVADGLVGQHLSYPKLVDAAFNVLWGLAVEIGTRSGSPDDDPVSADADGRVPARTDASELSNHLALGIDRLVGDDPVARVGGSRARPGGD